MVNAVLYMTVTMRMSLCYLPCLVVMLVSCVSCTTTFCPVEGSDYYDKPEGRTIKVRKHHSKQYSPYPYHRDIAYVISEQLLFLRKEIFASLIVDEVFLNMLFAYVIFEQSMAH